MPKVTYCCICGNKFIGYGNNPAPVDNHKNSRCCDMCNTTVVIPERIKNYYNKNN